MALKSTYGWMTYRVFGVVLDGVLYLSVGTVIYVCCPVIPPETREDGGSYGRQLKTQQRKRISVSFSTSSHYMMSNT